jgi:HK97 gp10 family phage protein
MSIRTKVVRKSNTAKVSKAYERKVQQIIAASAQMVRNTAVTSIHEHGSSGITYEKYNPRRTHTASSDGNPPNTDTGYLANNISEVIDGDKMGASVESRAEYSEFLEFGTSKMDARPFMQPALEENRPKIRRMFKRLKGSGL